MGKNIELTVITDLYSDPDEKGNQFLKKMNATYKISIDLTLIGMVGQVINKQGKISKGLCTIKFDGDTYLIKHSYIKLNKKIDDFKNKVNSIGFRYKNRK